MAESASLPSRFAALALAPLFFGAVLLGGCQPEQRPPTTSEAPAPDESAPPEVEESKIKLTEVEKGLEAKNTELTAATREIQALKLQVAEKDLIVGKKDAQLRTLQAEIDDLKKRDAFVFASISALQEKGDTASALSRYEQFIKDFPKSPLTAHAASAINELTVSTERAARQRADVIDPKSRERDFLQRFEEGFLTLQDLAPVLKKRSVAQVLALLGPPNRVFGEGTEIGYADRAVDPATGRRGMFIIAFEFDTVANLRVEYTGRRLVP